MGHAYGLDAVGDAAHAAFETALAGVARSCRPAAPGNLYGLLDNNDAFDYLGGLSLGVETLTGQRPEGLILQHADPAHPAVEPLATALCRTARPLPQPGMAQAPDEARLRRRPHDGAGFLENLWGWQVHGPS